MQKKDTATVSDYPDERDSTPCLKIKSEPAYSVFRYSIGKSVDFKTCGYRFIEAITKVVNLKLNSCIISLKTNKDRKVTRIQKIKNITRRK